MSESATKTRKPSLISLAKERGYEEPLDDLTGLRPNLNYDIVPVGQRIKAGDQVLIESGNDTREGKWSTLADKFAGLPISSNFRVVRRRKRWDCFHIREDRDTHCPVCMVFLRYVTKPW